MIKAVLIILVIALIIAPFVGWGVCIAKGIQFDAACGDYLMLAADANTIDVAEKHLTTAIEYLESNDLTSGYTKIFVYKPINDIGLWYENLKTAQNQLRNMQQTEYTELEASNMLMKLRETLLNEGGGLTHPEGISMVENYTLMFWLNVLLWIPCWIIAGIIGFELDYI
jgi:hypothetical protein